MRVSSRPAAAPSAMVLVTSLIEAARPKQWLKNSVLFIGVVFALRLTDQGSLLRSLWAFAVFCAVSSAGYFFNDLADAERDRQHPRKRRRPLASGRITRAHAVAAGCTLLAGGLGGAFALGGRFGLLVLAYVLLSFAYSARLKQIDWSTCSSSRCSS